MFRRSRNLAVSCLLALAAASTASTLADPPQQATPAAPAAEELHRLLKVVVAANTDSLKTANPDEAARVEALQERVCDLIDRTGMPASPPPQPADLGAPDKLPQSPELKQAVAQCGLALQNAASHQAQAQLRAAINPQHIASLDQAIDACGQADASAKAAYKSSVLSALNALLREVVTANSGALQAANADESTRLDNLQSKLITLVRGAGTAESAAKLPQASGLGTPGDLPKSLAIAGAVQTCQAALGNARARYDRSQRQAQAGVIAEFQIQIAAAIQKGDMAEASKLSAARAQFESGISRPADAPAAAGKTVDLLKLLDLKKGTVAGHWQIHDGTLQSDKTNNARIQFSYDPPAEYDYRVVFSQETGSNSFVMALLVAGHQTCWNMSGGGKLDLGGFESVGGKSMTAVPLVHMAKWFVPHQHYECVVKVRKNSVTVLLNGKTLCEDHANLAKYNMLAGWKLPDAHALGLGSWATAYNIYTAEVVEVSGSGKVLR